MQYFQSLRELLVKKTKTNSVVIIGGDFNAHIELRKRVRNQSIEKHFRFNFVQLKKTCGMLFADVLLLLSRP